MQGQRPGSHGGSLIHISTEKQAPPSRIKVVCHGAIVLHDLHITYFLKGEEKLRHLGPRVRGGGGFL